jgi:hypothetical protein
MYFFSFMWSKGQCSVISARSSVDLVAANTSSFSRLLHVMASS